VDPWDRTLQDRWDDVNRLLDAEWVDGAPGAPLVEAVEALVDEWHDVVVPDLVAAIRASPRLATTVRMCMFDERVPEAVIARLEAVAG
jgi:hypothetical protein